MKAIVITSPGGAEVLKIQEVEEPQIGEDEVLVKVEATAVNRADTLQRQGGYPVPQGASPYLGLECSGTILSVGKNVTGWKIGDQVFFFLWFYVMFWFLLLFGGFERWGLVFLIGCVVFVVNVLICNQGLTWIYGCVGGQCGLCICISNVFMFELVGMLWVNWEIYTQKYIALFYGLDNIGGCN